MNCKQGDLAIVTRSISGNNGKVITCLHLATDAELAELSKFGKLRNELIWAVDAPILLDRGKFYFVPDSLLTPLRGDLTTDTIEIPIKEIA
jgi:hypothetical protein